jgi:hypothetical protein
VQDFVGIGLNRTLAVVNFKRGGTYMSPQNLSMIAFLALIVWRFVFAGLRSRPWVRAIAPQQQRHHNVLEEALHISHPGGVAVSAGNRFENSSDDLDPLDRKDRAKRYLRRIVALTGATQMDDAYVLDVGKMRFRVGYRYVRRLRDMTDPECAYEETCFYPVHKGMPKAEEIATALLQLTNNPALFDKWAVQNGLAFKPDGQVFTRAK